MISLQRMSDRELRQMVAIVSQICLSQEFQELLEELKFYYRQAGQADYEAMAFKDALYVILQQSEEFSSNIKEFL
ncbi:MAG: hypothetical protein KAX49_06830 [Halanaerobiales bacterium]|nr:hypothetical protein [Halanaerobiales bacterium]